MTNPPRKFEAKPAIRASVPLLIGLMGPSGSGKTFSALRLATGIQRVTGGDIYGIDTEARRMLHYADQFKFRHIDFRAPFASLDYLAAISHCIAAGGKGGNVVIVDSMTHEHTGAGGYLQMQEEEMERMSKGDSAKRERVKMAAWIKPSALRRQMIDGIVQWETGAIIFCFRAKEKTKPNPRAKENEPKVIEMGFMPVAGDELLFEMTVNCLLPPRSNGVPQWRSDQIGEKLMMKLPLQFEKLFAASKSLDEEIGSAMASWAKGGSAASEVAPSPPQSEAVDDDVLAQIEESLMSAARAGTAALEQEWKSLHKKYRQAFAAKLTDFKVMASLADEGTQATL